MEVKCVASFKKRLLAYIIDVLFVIVLLMIFSKILPPVDVTKYNQEISILNENLITKKIKFGKYLNDYAFYFQKINQKQAYLNFLYAFLIFFYFVLYPFFTELKTVGEKICGLRLEKRDGATLSIKDYLIRATIIHALLYTFLVALMAYLLPAFWYFILVSILSLCQLLLVIVTGFMVLYKKEGLHDILTKSVVRGVK